MSRDRWKDLHAALDEAARVIFDDMRVDNPLAEAEAVRYLLRLSQFTREAEVENHDPLYPHLMRLESPYLQWGMPTADYVYWIAPVHGDHRYRFFGRRGTCQMFTVETWSGDWARIDQQAIMACKADTRDRGGELEIAVDGSFEIILGGEDAGANWLPLGDGLGTVLIREAYYDWETETAGDLYLERIDATYPAPPRDASTMAAEFGLMAEFLRTAPARLIRGVDIHYGAEPSTMVFPDLSAALGTDTGFPEQFYGRSHFRLEPDDAIVIEVTPPDCAFWDFQLGSQFWESYDWHQRQMTINGHQAVLDADGVFRAVIAQRHPGVPNWLDACGHPHGIVACRWNRVTGSDVPAPVLRTVPFDALRDELPAATPAVTPAERSETIRRRMHSVRRRLAA